MAEDGQYFVETFGCRVNQADTAGLVFELENSALKRAESRKNANVVILNTCTVTHRADVDVRKAVHRIKRENPSTKVIVTGCYAQRDPQAAQRIEGVSAVIGNSHKHTLPIVADNLVHHAPSGEASILQTSMEQLTSGELPPVKPTATVVDRTRPFVKIQDGCNATCTYCVIPSVRGPARSAPEEKALNTVKTLVNQGFKEIVLTGVHLGTYGAALTPKSSLSSLVRRMLTLPNLFRLRLSCIEPMAFPVELAAIAKEDPRLAPHFHLPLQSGDNQTLKRMVRPYRTEQFQALLDTVREQLPKACLGTDVIVGFPGETDEAFQTTLDFIEDSGLNYVHVFSYSDREGTASTRLGNKVEPRIVKERSVRLHKLAEQLWHKFLESRVGETRKVVSLERNPKDTRFVRALSDDYCPVRLEGPDLAPNQVYAVSLLRREQNILRAKVIESAEALA